MKTDDLEYAMIEGYTIALKVMNKDSNESDNEITLSELSGTWFICGKKGHKYNKCNEENSSNKVNMKYSKVSGNYNMCVKRGHMDRDCFEIEEISSKSSINWKSCLTQSEVANADIGSSL